jgi:hypothetical protein
MTDMVAAYSVIPRSLSSAQDVLETAAKVRAFRAAHRPKLVYVQSSPMTPAEPEVELKPDVVWPEWPNIRFLGQCLRDYGNQAMRFPSPVRRCGPSIDSIQRAICRHSKLSKIDLIAARRDMRVCLPRQIAMWICRKVTIHTYPEIGRRFGGRDHTTAIHAFKKIERMRAQDDPVVCEAIRSVLVEVGAYIHD